MKYTTDPDRSCWRTENEVDKPMFLCVGRLSHTGRVPAWRDLRNVLVPREATMTDDFNVSFTRDAHGVLALQYLREPSRSDADADELLVQANVVRRADAYTGAAVRALIETHLVRAKSRHVCLWLPDDGPVDLFADLVGPLPERCVIPEDTPRPLRDRNVILPATPLRSFDEARAAAWLLKTAAAPAARVDPRTADLLAQALLAFAENGLNYARDSRCGVVVCCAVDSETERVSVVAIDQGQDFCRSDNLRDRLRDCLDASAVSLGGFGALRRLAKKQDLDAKITLSSGSARVRRPGKAESPTPYVPGFCAALTVQIEMPRRKQNG